MTVDAPRPATPPTTRRHARWTCASRPFALVTAFCTILALTGCGLRWQTPAPTEPSPHAAEELRRSAVADALTVQQKASAAAASATDPAVGATLTQIAEFAESHVTALGGVYDSGLGNLASPTPVDSSTPMPTTATPEDAVLALVSAAEHSTAAIDTVKDGEVARLLASISTSETLSARRLATQIGSTSADALAAAPLTVAEVPAGVGASDLSTIVTAEDSAGYALEVQAALVDGDQKSALVAAAATHRLLAEQWALASTVAATPQDPRRIAYVLPQGLDAAGLVQQLDGGLSQSYATLVGISSQGSRTTPAALLLQSATEAAAWGAAPVAFPGLPEAVTP